tara:strand:- start:5024 stop:6034 length:1011 start_codon:yes stop_codon:yes gene_type:complete
VSADWFAEHGGGVRAAADRWGRPPEDWLDLSTGINPHGWPVPALAPDVWRRLPEPDDGLEDLARAWAGAPATAGCLMLPGTQAAIQSLPGLRAPGTVAVPYPGYGEHARRWRDAGHTVVAMSAHRLPALAEQVDALVWVQPNNPTGEWLPRAALLDARQRLAARGGWLIVDEAFLDDPDLSLAPYCGEPGLLVLRSLGKTFGLAGIRAGALLGPPALCLALNETLGPWAMSGPARAVAALALADQAWQRHNRRRLAISRERLQALLERHRLPAAGHTDLFVYCRTPRARRIADHLARRAILVRGFDDPPALRFGLPGEESEWRRLEQALADSPSLY